MPKQYCLKRDWPDAEVGDIYQWNGQGYSNQTRTAMVLSKKYVEAYSSWFEEVVQKEWEIVEFRHGAVPYRLTTKGGVTGYCHGSEYGIPHSLEEMLGLKYPTPYIYSVKRLSDGEVFRIENDIIWNEVNHGRIKSFEISPRNNGMIAKYYEHHGVNIMNITKSEKFKPTSTFQDEDNEWDYCDECRQLVNGIPMGAGEEYLQTECPECGSITSKVGRDEINEILEELYKSSKQWCDKAMAKSFWTDELVQEFCNLFTRIPITEIYKENQIEKFKASKQLNTTKEERITDEVLKDRTTKGMYKEFIQRQPTSSQPQNNKERIEVRILPTSHYNFDSKDYLAIEFSSEISKEKLPAIKQAIENILNS